ncbi:class I SAM-dependent methyltransferase [Paraburkholderia bryophila]|uniref:class I SAM-dependent methyltransferase n=1 Tax=Paraburkholderia bryophila TaxID=420952 RepID=UPI002348F674|nr:class I SAM-dependent methyltransferase [Paraburkholderia bryophila]WCM22512.1 class I SAM-dependent methyltransferase [Paraburkholderia bryophila]
MGVVSPAELYLQDFHQRVTGATGAAFNDLRARYRQREYPSSYHVLASCVPDLDEAQTVLDLACGDGHLLKLLAEPRRSSLRLTGVDMSQGELDAARACLPADVVLLKERAQQLSIDTGSVDCVLSHMAMMLMDDIDQVLGEIRRVLRSEGHFAAVVGRTFLLGEVNEVFLEVFRPIAREDLPHLPFGDRRTRTEAGWTELLGPHFKDVLIEDVDVGWQPTPEELWQSLTETYDIDRLSVGARERLRRELLQAVSSLRLSDGKIRTGWGLRMVRAQAA